MKSLSVLTGQRALSFDWSLLRPLKPCTPRFTKAKMHNKKEEQSVNTYHPHWLNFSLVVLTSIYVYWLMLSPFKHVHPVIYVLYVLIVMVWFKVLVFLPSKYSYVALVAFVLGLYYFFFGAFFVISDEADLAYSQVDMVVFTFPGSYRTDSTYFLFADAYGFEPRLFYSVKASGQETLSEILNGTGYQEYAHVYTIETFPGRVESMRFGSYVRYMSVMKRAMEQEGNVKDWILIMEDDARPVHPRSFPQRLHQLLERVDPKVDVIVLDYRNIFNKINPRDRIFGGVGVLYRYKELGKIHDVLFPRDESQPYFYYFDYALGEMRNQGLLNVQCEYLLIEDPAGVTFF